MKALLIIFFVCSAFIIAGNPGAGQGKSDTVKSDRLDSLEKRMDSTETSIKISETKINISETLINRNKEEVKEVRRLAWNLKKKSKQVMPPPAGRNGIAKNKGKVNPEQISKAGTDSLKLIVRVFESPVIKDTIARKWYKPKNEDGLLAGWKPFKFLKRKSKR